MPAIQLVGVTAATLAVLVAVLAALWDVGTGRIPNRLNYLALLAGWVLGVGLALFIAVDSSIDNALMSGLDSLLMGPILGLLFGAVPGLVLFALGSLGGGDVKLLAALGSLLGGAMIIDVWLLAIICGAVLAIVTVVSRGRAREVAAAMGWNILSMLYPSLQRSIPARDLTLHFALPVAVATVLVLSVPAVRPVAVAFPGLFGG